LRAAGRLCRADQCQQGQGKNYAPGAVKSFKIHEFVNVYRDYYQNLLVPATTIMVAVFTGSGLFACRERIFLRRWRAPSVIVGSVVFKGDEKINAIRQE